MNKTKTNTGWGDKDTILDDLKTFKNDGIVSKRSWNEKKDFYPNEEYQEQQSLESLFKKKRNCRLFLGLGETLSDLELDECMQFCENSPYCSSFDFKPRKNEHPSMCVLSLESKYEDGGHSTVVKRTKARDGHITRKSQIISRF